MTAVLPDSVESGRPAARTLVCPVDARMRELVEPTGRMGRPHQGTLHERPRHTFDSVFDTIRPQCRLHFTAMRVRVQELTVKTSVFVVATLVGLTMPGLMTSVLAAPPVALIEEVQGEV